jgi:hypothetical protein
MGVRVRGMLLIFSFFATAFRSGGGEDDSSDGFSRRTDGDLPQLGLCRLTAILTQR